MLGIEDRNLGSIINDLQRGFDFVRITVIDVIRIHLNIIREIRDDLVDQRSNVRLILAKIRFLKEFVLLQKHVIVDTSAFAVFDIILFIELYGNDC